jgi:PAS domain S-box-containing protein
VVGVLLWTILIAASLAWNIYEDNSRTLDVVRREAASNFNKDRAIRLWATAHGGVYVPPNDRTPPNPYLSHVPERDIVTASGKKLTLMNPAYILRQTMSEYEGLYGIHGHITSLNPINPANAPDPWERQALKAFESGQTEMMSRQDIRGEEYLRFMKPLVTKPGCLKCHAEQGYKVGDIRGGVSLSVPMGAHLAAHQARANHMIFTHSALWVAGMVGIFMAYWQGGRRITTRKRSREELEAKEQYFRSLLYNMHEDILVIDSDYVIRDVNNTTLITTGLRREETIGRCCYELLHDNDEPCDLPGGQCPVREVFLTGRPHSCQHTHKNKYGADIHVDILASPMTDESGRITHVVEAIRDITPLVEALEQKHASDQRYRSVVEDSPGLICSFTPEGVITFVNDGYCRYFSKTQEELLGSEFIFLIPVDSREAVMASISALTADSPIMSHEHQVIAPGGVIRWHRWTNRALFDRDGQLVLYQAFGADITEQKNLEAQLRQSQRMEAIGRLAGGIAHDFRNQLSVIVGYGEMLLSRLGEGSPGISEIREILQAANRSTVLTGRLLSFCRKEMLEPRIVAPMTLIESLTKPLKHIIGENVRLTVSGADNLGNITVDTGQFEHMLINLVVNARDAMPDGGDLKIDAVSVELDGEFIERNPGSAPGNYVAISVSDSGVGMDAETCRHAFEPFFTTKGVGEGTGLGLSMAYGFVTQSGGCITIDSEPGKGTVFTIYLPSTSEPPEETESAGEVELVEVDIAAGAILVVEDDEQLRGMLVDLLQKDGHTVLSAANSREALPLGEHYDGHIDILITDVVMPGMNGVDLAVRLRAARPDIVVMFISGYGDNELIKRCVADGDAELLIKPFGVGELFAAVNRMLARRHAKPEV